MLEPTRLHLHTVDQITFPTAQIVLLGDVKNINLTNFIPFEDTNGAQQETLNDLKD